MTLTKIPVSAATSFALTAELVAPYLTPEVVCVYTSAPTFPHGVVDKVTEVAALAAQHGVGVHVDNCLGGILLSYQDRLGLGPQHQEWTFKAPGVTTISVDIHKYGNASKGSSVVVFRDQALRRMTYLPVMDGCEGLYVTSTIQGARSGANIAQAWATMLYHGDSGYDQMARTMHAHHTAYQQAIKTIPGLRILCTCHASIVPIASDKYNIYAVASLMEDKGWNLFTGQMPPVMSVCIGERHGEILEAFMGDLKEAVRHLEGNPGYKPEGTAAVYGAMATTPDAVLEEVVRRYVDLKLAVKPKLAGA